MSLINEALKRTRDAAYQPVHAPSPSTPEYRLENAVEPGAPKKKLLAMTVIAGLALGVVVLIAWRLSVREYNTIIVPQQSEVVAPATPVASAPAKAEATSSPLEAKASEDQIVAKVMEKMKADQAVASISAPSEPPKLVLQGITYAKEGSDAMINGATVHEGEEIEGARVVIIESRRVTLDFGGHEIVLRLP